jgi:hypothetical protein
VKWADDNIKIPDNWLNLNLRSTSSNITGCEDPHHNKLFWCGCHLLKCTMGLCMAYRNQQDQAGNGDKQNKIYEDRKGQIYIKDLTYD